MAKLVLDKVDKTYFGGYIACKDISFSVESGEVLTIFAKSGGGKSTVLKLISLLEEPTGGSITIDGKDIKDIGIKDINISFATQELPLFRTKSVEYNLSYPLIIRKVDKDKITSRVHSIAELFGIRDILEDHIKFLSPSVKARVILARAFVRESDFYLIDNILYSFSLDDREEVLTILSELLPKVKGGVIYATNRLEEVSLLGGDNAIIMSHGYMVDKGDISDIYREPSTLESIRLLSNYSVGEFERKVEIDDNGKYIDLFGKHYIAVDDVYIGKPIVVTVNMEDVVLGGNKDTNKGIVTRVYRGIDNDTLIVSYGGEDITAIAHPKEYKVGDDISVSVRNIKLFDKIAERRIIGGHEILNSEEIDG